MHGYVYKVSCSPSTPLLTLTLTLKTWRVHARRYAVAKVLTAGDGAWGAPTRGNESIKRLKWGGVYFGVKYTNVQRVQMGTKPAKVGRLASTLLKYVGSAQRRPPPPRSSPPPAPGGPKLLVRGCSGVSPFRSPSERRVATHESSSATSRIPLPPRVIRAWQPLGGQVPRCRGGGGDTSSRGQKGASLLSHSVSKRRVDSLRGLYDLSRSVSNQL